MKISVLIENTACGADFKGQHGLSFYIESNGAKILFDCGADGLFLENAEKLNINISEVDYLILSHGHYDHGGGLKDFIEANSKAKILLSKHVFGDYYFKVLFYKKYIGLDKSLKDNGRFIFVDRELKINNGAVIFSGITGEKYRSQKSKLLKRESNKFSKDDFKHE